MLPPRPLTLLAIRALKSLNRPATRAEIFDKITSYGVRPYSITGLATELNDFSASVSNAQETTHGRERAHFFEAIKRGGPGGANLWKLTGKQPEAPVAPPDVSTSEQYLTWCRTKQQAFRQAALKHWSGRCCITGLDLANILVAAHIWPWSEATDAERVDPYNSLLLSPTYDKLFDNWLITFRMQSAGTATIVPSPWVEANGDLLGISLDAQITGLDMRSERYLKRHNERFTKEQMT